MVEYAQPNTHHSFHIGHARNTIAGRMLARIVEFAGFDTIRAYVSWRYGTERDYRAVGLRQIL